MRPIAHPANPPIALQRAIERGRARWDGFTEKAAVVEVLVSIQKCLCAYCQVRLDSGIGHHIEHIWPQHRYPEKAFCWQNLVLSCTDPRGIAALHKKSGLSCGHSNGKRSWPDFDARFISPTEPDCDRYFAYFAADGTVQPMAGLSEEDAWRVRYTIDLLDLNCRRLCRLRKDMLEEGYRIIRELRGYSDALQYFLENELGETSGKLQSFVVARRQHFSPFACEQ